jgi:glycine/D-amino acid oxidase-like deaminating enzyme
LSDPETYGKGSFRYNHNRRGVIGCSTAYHLIQSDAGLALAVIEKDPTYQFASISLSLGNIRIQFSLKENIQISQYAMKVLERFYMGSTNRRNSRGQNPGHSDQTADFRT